jgi:hypothetical protein
LHRVPKEGRLAMNVRRPLAVVALAVVGTVTFPGPALADASTGDDPFVVATGELAGASTPPIPPPPPMALA